MKSSEDVPFQFGLFLDSMLIFQGTNRWNLKKYSLEKEQKHLQTTIFLGSILVFGGVSQLQRLQNLVLKISIVFNSLMSFLLLMMSVR